MTYVGIEAICRYGFRITALNEYVNEATTERRLMYFEVHGSGFPLLCLHGFPLDHQSLMLLDPVFAHSGKWKRIYVDLPGMGLSASSPNVEGYDGVLDALLDFIDREIGEQKYAIFGYSFGGILGRGIIQARPQTVLGLGMLCPEIISDQKLRSLPPRHTVVHSPQLLQTLDPAERDIYESTSVIETRENWDKFAKFILPAFSKFNREAAASITADSSLPGLPEAPGFRYEGPTLVITGRQDNLVGYQDAFKVLDHYPHASYALLDRAGHTAHLDQLGLVSVLIEDWLERVVVNGTILSEERSS